MEANIGRVESFVGMVASSTWIGFALAGIALAAGLVLWLRGRGLMRWVAALMGAASLGSTGFTLVAMVANSTGDAAAKPWHGLLAGIVIGGVLGATGYRWMLASGCGVIACVVAAGGAWMAVGNEQHEPAIVVASVAKPSSSDAVAVSDVNDSAATDKEINAAALKLLREQLQRNPAGTGGVEAGLFTPGEKEPPPAVATARRDLADKLKSVFGEGVTTQMAKTGAFGGFSGASLPKLEEESKGASLQTRLPESMLPFTEQSGQISKSWNAMPRSKQATIVAAGAVGLALGMVAGAWAAGMAAVVMSSLVGAAMGLAGLAWLSIAMHAPWCGVLERTAGEWGMIWLAAAAVGMGVQWWTRRGGEGAAPRTARA